MEKETQGKKETKVINGKAYALKRVSQAQY
jgi:hypothetical protein